MGYRRRKHILAAVETNLRRLRTEYVDVFQVHRLDRETSPEEINVRVCQIEIFGEVEGVVEFVNMQECEFCDPLFGSVIALLKSINF